MPRDHERVIAALNKLERHFQRHPDWWIKGKMEAFHGSPHVCFIGGLYYYGLNDHQIHGIRVLHQQRFRRGIEGFNDSTYTTLRDVLHHIRVLRKIIEDNPDRYYGIRAWESYPWLINNIQTTPPLWSSIVTWFRKRRAQRTEAKALALGVPEPVPDPKVTA